MRTDPTPVGPYIEGEPHPLLTPLERPSDKENALDLIHSKICKCYHLNKQCSRHDKCPWAHNLSKRLVDQQTTRRQCLYEGGVKLKEETPCQRGCWCRAVHTIHGEHIYKFPRQRSTDHELLSDLETVFTKTAEKLGKEAGRELKTKDFRARHETEFKRAVYARYNLYLPDLSSNIWQPTHKILKAAIEKIQMSQYWLPYYET